MPKLTYEIPNSKWPRVVERARREGVSIRALVLAELLDWLAKPETSASEPEPQPEAV